MKSYLLLLALFFPFSTYAEFQAYSGLVGGATLQSETQASASYRHESQFLFGHLGVAVGGGYQFVAGALGLGVKGEVAWLGNTIDRKTEGTSDKTGYRDETTRGLAGVTVSYRPGPMMIDFEYYPWVNNWVNYSDAKSENPYRKNDTWTGTGWAAGFSFKFFPPMRNFIQFRRLTYGNTTMNSSSVTLPNSTWSVLKLDEVILGFGSEF